ncbi:MAG: hypothetical protein AAFY88_20405 [Acidobacteriota bacterium]
MVTALRAYLVLLALGNSAIVAHFLFNPAALKAQYPMMCNYLITASIVGGVASVVATVLLWRFRALGIAMIVTACIGVLIVNLYIGAGLAYTAAGPLSVAVLLALLWPLRDRFKAPRQSAPTDSPAIA